MPRAKTAGRTALFNSLVEQSLSEHNDCAVKAVAIVTDTPYEKVREMMRAIGRKDRRGTKQWITLKCIEQLGFKATWRSQTNFIALYPGVHSAVLRHVTSHHPERFNKVWRNGKRYLFFVRGHVLPVVNGTNHDWTRGRAKRVLDIAEIEKV